MKINMTALNNTAPITKRVIQFFQRIHGDLPDPLPSKNIFNKKCPRQQFRKPSCDSRDYRVQSIPQRMPENHCTFAQSFCISRADIILRKCIQHGTPCKLGDHGQWPDAQGKCRENKIFYSKVFFTGHFIDLERLPVRFNPV